MSYYHAKMRDLRYYGLLGIFTHICNDNIYYKEWGKMGYVVDYIDHTYCDRCGGNHKSEVYYVDTKEF